MVATQPVVLDWPLALILLLVATAGVIAAVFAGMVALAALIGLKLPQARGESPTGRQTPAN
ncbi:MAG: hypothetical protein C4316_05780 [Chloroflexota bacterium]